MKTRLYSIAILFAALNFYKGNAQTNKSLSNLTAPTAVNVSLLPKTDASTDGDNALDLGNLDKSWQSLFLSGRIYINDSIAMLARGTGNFFTGISAGNITYKGTYNTGLGFNALHKLSSGSYNTAAGYNALYSNGAGSSNNAVGYLTLNSNTTGSHNTANGYIALNYNTSGNYNTGYGSWALRTNVTGNNNTGVGYSALWLNATGNDNTAIGKYSMYSNSTGYSNVAAGTGALYKNTNGFHLVAIGDSALYNFNTTDYYGGSNTALGSKTLYYTTTGTDNTAIGYEALKANTTGTANTATGFALVSNTTGSYNTANGFTALNAGGGSYNTAVGAGAMLGYEGSYNTAIGAYAGGYYDLFNQESNSTSIGYNADVWQSNQVRIGNSNVTSIGGQVGWTTFSDGRYKKNIKENVSGLAFINSLKPITYTVDTKSLNEYLNKGKKQVDKNGKEMLGEKATAAMNKATEEAGKIIYDGFVAQEVEAAAKKSGFEFSGVDKPATKDGLYGLRYDNFVVPLVKAVQELSKQNDELRKQNNEQEKRIEKLEALMNVSSLNTTQASKNIFLSDAMLEQNVPNPFSNSTTIRYTLSQKFTDAAILITNNVGKTIKQITVSNSKGTVNIDASTLSSGVYNYSLVVDGKLIDTKQMAHLK